VTDISEAGSVDLPGPWAIPFVGRVFLGREALPATGPTARRPPSAAGPESEIADFIQCLSGAQAKDSGWPIFKGKYVEYPRLRKEWWAYRRMYHAWACKV
jgi:hypothetical protein